MALFGESLEKGKLEEKGNRVGYSCQDYGEDSVLVYFMCAYKHKGFVL